MTTSTETHPTIALLRRASLDHKVEWALGSIRAGR